MLVDCYIFLLIGFLFVVLFAFGFIFDIISNRFLARLNNINQLAKLKMFTKLTLIIFFLIVIFSIFMAGFFRLISNEKDFNNEFKVNDTLIKNDPIRIGNTPNNILWFVQISDVHLSWINDPKRKSELIEFCKDTIPYLKLPILILTGDITDGRTGLPLGSDSYQAEWKMYNEVLEKCHEYNPNLKWLDVRGNHGKFVD